MAMPRPRCAPAVWMGAAPVLAATEADEVREPATTEPPETEADGATVPEERAEPDEAADAADPDAVEEPATVDEPDAQTGAVFTLMFWSLHS